jgi:hypothetical protein
MFKNLTITESHELSAGLRAIQSCRPEWFTATGSVQLLFKRDESLRSMRVQNN